MTRPGADNFAHPLADRGLDQYQTPPEAVRALLGVEALPAVIWEPAAGEGNIVRALQESGRTCWSSEIDPGYAFKPDDCEDFFKSTSAPAGCNCIVTNPPFKDASQFISHSLALVDHVHMLLRVNFWEGGTKDDLRDLVIRRNPPRRCWVFRERLPMMHRRGWTGKTAASSMTFAWFYWQRGFKGRCDTAQISWRNPRSIRPVPTPKGQANPNQMEIFATQPSQS